MTCDGRAMIRGEQRTGNEHIRTLNSIQAMLSWPTHQLSGLAGYNIGDLQLAEGVTYIL